jgi:carboxyl-terminal processing protease
MVRKLRKLLLFLIVAMALGTGLLYSNVANQESVEDSRGFLGNISELKEISDIMDIISENFVGEKEIDKKELLHGAIKGMMQSLDDPHSTYFPAKEMKSFTEDMKGEYAGVGMVVSKKDNVLTVVSPIEGTPAYKAGMKPNDKIVKIEDKATMDLTVDECVDILKGKPGTKVNITVFRESTGKSFDVELTRAIIKLKYVRHRLIEDSIGYVKLTQFSENVSKDVRKAVEDLRSRGMESMILDLRYNPGGSLGEAIKVSSIFLEKSPIVTVKDKHGNVEEYDRIGKGYTDFPMVVLINEGSASASEIVSGAIKDYERGLLLGEKSYGKGSVQNLVPLNDGDALKLTIAKYYTPSGTCIHKKGIEPDIKVKEPEGFIPFDGFITNIAKEDTTSKGGISKEEKENKEKEEKEEESKEEEENKVTKLEDEQLKMAINVLKGIKLYMK